MLDRSWVSQQDLDKARQRKKPGQELAEVLVEMGALEPQRLARALAQEYRLPFQAHIDETHARNRPGLARFPINYAKKNRLLPLATAEGAVTVAIADPANYEPLDDLHVLFGDADQHGGRAGRSHQRSDQSRLRSGGDHHRRRT